MDTLLHDDLNVQILAIADELAEQFVNAMRASSDFDLIVALAGLQLTFLSRVAALTNEQR